MLHADFGGGGAKYGIPFVRSSCRSESEGAEPIHYTAYGDESSIPARSRCRRHTPVEGRTRRATGAIVT